MSRPPAPVIDLDAPVAPVVIDLEGDDSVAHGPGSSVAHARFSNSAETAIDLDDDDGNAPIDLDDDSGAPGNQPLPADTSGVEEVAPPKAAKRSLSEAVDDDLEVTGTGGTGLLAADMPHARCNCPLKRFKKSQAKKASPENVLHCEQCWCFVCEKPVRQCPQWDSVDVARPAHCNAHAGFAMFKKMRRADSGVREQDRSLTAAQSR